MYGSDPPKGLHKLKYFCQICNKQLKDRDGYKCHLNSAFHKQNIELVSQNPDYYINNYSQEFESGFLEILKRSYPNSLVSANKVYQEYIADKYSTHLNATKWTNLSSFIQHLKNSGKCIVEYDETESKVRYVDNSPEALREKLKFEKKQKVTEKEEKQKRKHLEKVMERANNTQETVQVSEVIKVAKVSYIEVPVEELSFNVEFKAKPTFNRGFKNFLPEKKIQSQPQHQSNNEEKQQFLNSKRKAEDELPHSSAKPVDDQKFDKDKPWLMKSLIVKIKDKSIQDGAYFDKKGLVIGLVNDYLAEVQVIGTDVKMKIDQNFLEPVIPALKSKVKILYGELKSQTGTIETLDIKGRKATITLEEKSHLLDLTGICKFSEN